MDFLYNMIIVAGFVAAGVMIVTSVRLFRYIFTGVGDVDTLVRLFNKSGNFAILFVFLVIVLKILMEFPW